MSRRVELIAPPAEQLLGWIGIGLAGLAGALRHLGVWVDAAGFAYV